MSEKQTKTISAGRAIVPVAPRSSHCSCGADWTIARQLEFAKERYIDAKRRAVDHAPTLIQEVCQSMSLRDLAKRVDKSPTYISQIATGKIECSDEVYFALSGVASGISVAE